MDKITGLYERQNLINSCSALIPASAAQLEDFSAVALGWTANRSRGEGPVRAPFLGQF